MPQTCSKVCFSQCNIPSFAKPALPFGTRKKHIPKSSFRLNIGSLYPYRFTCARNVAFIIFPIPTCIDTVFQWHLQLRWPTPVLYNYFDASDRLVGATDCLLRFLFSWQRLLGNLESASATTLTQRRFLGTTWTTFYCSLFCFTVLVCRTSPDEHMFLSGP